MLSSIAIWVSLYFDRVLISQLLSVQEVGIYGIGYRLASLSSLIMMGFQTSLLPIIYSNLNRNETPKHIDKIFRYFLAIVFSFFLFLSFSVTEILEIIAPATYKNAAGLIFFLVPSIFISGMNVFVPGINIGKKTSYYIWINIMGALVNLLLNLYLIPIFGINGSALATMFSSFLVFCIQYNISQKYYYVPFRLAPIFINMMLVFAFSYCVLILKNPIISSLPMRIILFILFILSIIYSRLIDNEDFLYLKQRIKKLYN